MTALAGKPWQENGARYMDARGAVSVAEHGIAVLHAPPPGELGRVEVLAVVAGTAVDLIAEIIDRIEPNHRDWEEIARAVGLDKATVWRLWRAVRDDPGIYI
jgi:hypothetical protein